MNYGPQLLLIVAVAAVGVLHTMVPDHWLPIALLARQRGWSRAETARASLKAGIGHVLSTLLIALCVWLAGVAAANRFGHVVDAASSVGLVIFGGWIAISSWHDLRKRKEHGGDHHTYSDDGGLPNSHDALPENDSLDAPLAGDREGLTRQVHGHRHPHGSAHVHWHDHAAVSMHTITGDAAMAAPGHDQRHKTSAHTALLLMLGSSPMVEGIPAFFAAGKYGLGLILVMAVVFAIGTIATYVLLCVYSTARLQRVRLGAFEQYGEVLSGVFIVVVGIVFWIWT